MRLVVRTLLGCLALAALYFAGGVLAHQLALPPSQVMPIWPSAGVALVALWRYGRHWWPGIVLGSLLFNALIYLPAIAVPTETAPTNAVMAWLAALLIGLGAAAQALLAVALLRRFGGSTAAPMPAGRLLQQALLIGPLACLVSPLIGVGALLVLQQLPMALAPEAALTWWLGDTMGVIALLPLLYLWQPQAQPLAHRRWWLSATVLLTASLVVITTLNLRERELIKWQAQQSVIHHRILHRFEQQQAAVQQALITVRALFVSSSEVTRAEFRTFASEQLQFAPAITTLEWVPRVAGEARSEFEREQRRYEPAFEIRQQSAGVLISALPRSEYFPITFLEPLSGNRTVLGLDLLAEPSRAEFVRRIQHSRRFQVSEPVQLAQASETDRRVLAGLPYPAAVGDRDAVAMSGLLVATLQVPTMLQAAVGDDAESRVQVQLWLEDNDGHSQLLANWPMQAGSINNVSENAAGESSSDSADNDNSNNDNASSSDISNINATKKSLTSDPATEFTLRFGDRHWRLLMRADAAQAPSLYWMWLFLTAGLVLSAALGIYLLSSHHYTVRVEAEVAERTRELLVARDQAVAASQAKSQFLASMSHEIRTPLTAIMGYTELLIDDRHTADTVKPTLAVVLDSSRTLLTLINDVLDLSKIEAGHMALHLQSCSVLAVVQDVVQLLRPRAEQKELLLLTEYRFPLPALVSTDPLRLRQVLLNLLGNAIKFTDIGQVSLSLQAQTQAGQVHFELVIRDTGIGIAPAHLQRIFEPFEQLDSGHSRRFGGTGLGLAIARQLARLLGGDITVSSALNQGSVFTLRFVAEAIGEQQLVSEFERAPLFDQQAERPQFAGHVLVAEDNPVNAKLATQLLQSCGLQVDIASDGLVALSMLERARQQGSPYALVFMDMQMPRMDGYEATQKLRAAGFKLPVIALTANAMSGDRERCIAAGCDDFASKPFQRSEIEALLRQYLSLKPFD